MSKRRGGVPGRFIESEVWVDLDMFDNEEIEQEAIARGIMFDEDNPAISLPTVQKVLQLNGCPEWLIDRVSEYFRAPVPTPEKLEKWRLMCAATSCN